MVDTRGGRRAFLSRVGAAVGTTGLFAGRAVAAPDDAFDPAVHGFGFRNWSTRSDLFPDHDHDVVTREEVRRTVGRNWADPLFALAPGPTPASLPDSLVDAIATQLYVSANQLSATNGHCYGMAFAAQSYYEHPERVPLDRESAAAFVSPAEPAGSAAEPVGDEIDLYQTAQVLDLEAWLGRRALLRPATIDYRRELAAVTDAIDADGTAGLTLLAGDSRRYHQVLAYDYRRRGSGTDLLVYDPNYPAGAYGTERDRAARRITVTPGESPPTSPYNGYDGFVTNRADRRIRLRNDPDAGGDGTSVGGLFPVLAVTLRAPEGSLSVLDPDGRPVSRDRAAFMDPAAADGASLRYRYGAPTGTYRVAVAAAAETPFTLDVRAAGVDGDRLTERREGRLAAGETRTYEATVPASGEGELTAAGDGVDPRTLAALAGGAAVGLGAATALRRRRGGADPE